jgi:hypothetical protein
MVARCPSTHGQGGQSALLLREVLRPGLLSRRMDMDADCRIIDTTQATQGIIDMTQATQGTSFIHAAAHSP